MDENLKKKLIICTEDFPYGDSEVSFIEPEVEELIKHFEVVLIAHDHNERADEMKKKIGEGWEAYNIDIQLAWYKRIRYGIQFFLDKDGWREFTLILESKGDILQKLYQSIGFYALAMENFRLMKKKNLLPTDEEFIYYTYWYFYYTYSMTKKKNTFKNVKIVTRAHGFDLFDERYNGGRQPFKYIMDERLDKVFFVAEQGKNYYLNKYSKENSDKYIISRLGTMKREGKCSNEEPIFRIVSCSSIIPLKRVDLLVKALSRINKKIEWVHFGSGMDMDKVCQLADSMLSNKVNIVYKFKGYVSNDKIMEYYSSHYVNCFISVSSTEGLPVSIQEAMSFGIPIVATDVGGVAELIGDNGILLSSDPSEEQIAKAIESIMDVDEKRYLEFRCNSFKLWEKNFNAEKNRKNFAEILEMI